MLKKLVKSHSCSIQCTQYVRGRLSLSSKFHLSRRIIHSFNFNELLECRRKDMLILNLIVLEIGLGICFGCFRIRSYCNLLYSRGFILISAHFIAGFCPYIQRKLFDTSFRATWTVDSYSCVAISIR